MFQDFLFDFQDFAQTFYRAGKKVLLVGGAVRNRLLGLPPGDFDFATDALPDEVKKLFAKVVPTGLQHGTVTVLFKGKKLEVTTFRIDGKSSDSRHPDQINFTRSLEEDLYRRDFTVNALALDLHSGDLVDKVGGLDDLKRRILRAIGNPHQRFEEDALRIFRLFRFAAQFDFVIEENTRQAARERKNLLSRLSRERVRDEVMKTFYAPHASIGWRAWETDHLLPFIFPLAKGIELSDSILMELDKLPQVWRVVYARHAACGPQVPRLDWEKDLRGLALSNENRTNFVKAMDFLQGIPSGPPSSSAAKALLFAWGKKDLLGLDDVMKALARKAEVLWSPDQTDRWIRLFSEIFRNNEPVFLKEMAVGGRDLENLGLPPGPFLGKLLQKLLRDVWEDPSLNTRERLLALAKSTKSESRLLDFL